MAPARIPLTRSSRPAAWEKPGMQIGSAGLVAGNGTKHREADGGGAPRHLRTVNSNSSRSSVIPIVVSRLDSQVMHVGCLGHGEVKCATL
jgi:hypothetical protein